MGICVNKSRLTQYGNLTDTASQINAFKAWLSDNSVWIKYELATPIVTDITDLFTEDNAIQIQQGGIIRFVNANEMAVPNTVGYVTRKE
jgi:ABC-type transport system involved in cytochrome c biogenesis ATPase subunit